MGAFISTWVANLLCLRREDQVFVYFSRHSQQYEIPVDQMRLLHMQSLQQAMSREQQKYTHQQHIGQRGGLHIQIPETVDEPSHQGNVSAQGSASGPCSIRVFKVSHDRLLNIIFATLDFSSAYK